MSHTDRAELVELGLSPTEAQVYLALVQSSAVSASTIASATGLSRTSVYQILCALADRGLVESGAGYGSKFAAVAPGRALPALVAQEEETLARRKELAERLSLRLATLAEPNETLPGELIEVLRTPRAVVERFERLQREAARQIDFFNKPPFFQRTGNPIQDKAQRRGVRYRGLYEKSGLENSAVTQFFNPGEEARVYEGELPHKLAIFDAQIVLMPLIRPGEQTKTMLIRHPQLARSLTLAFEHLWERSVPLRGPTEKNAPDTDTKSDFHVNKAVTLQPKVHASPPRGERGGIRSRRAKKISRTWNVRPPP